MKTFKKLMVLSSIQSLPVYSLKIYLISSCGNEERHKLLFFLGGGGANIRQANVDPHY